MSPVNDRLVASTIVEALDRNGAQELEDLYKSVQKLHADLDRRFFEKTLMALEIQGILRVQGMTKDRHRVELARR
ncbi:MAG: hypothetical protein NWE79_07730 [Candidatus Bathyarchaeota archaeon]|nr:hypothetical protein [Candidatus Bathyarchaeota archaeon]